MPFSFAIFDMDGTLVDSMGYWDRSCSEIIQYTGKADPNLLDILKPMTIEQIVAYLREKLHLEITKEQLIQTVYVKMTERYKNDICAKPGLFEFLEHLKRNNVRMCVATSSPANMVGACLKRLNLEPYFEFLISSEEIGKGKNDPDIYYEAAKRMGASPADTMVFEDSMAAGLTAKSAGFQVAAVYDEIGKAEWDAFYPEADVVIRAWNEAVHQI